MKLINIQTKAEGQILDRAYVCLGRKTETYTKDGIEKTRYNGFHFSLTLPIKRVRPCIDLRTWGLTQGEFQPIFLCMVRRPRGRWLPRFFWQAGWLGDDPDLSAVSQAYADQEYKRLQGV